MIFLGFERDYRTLQCLGRVGSTPSCTKHRGKTSIITAPYHSLKDISACQREGAALTLPGGRLQSTAPCRLCGSTLPHTWYDSKPTVKANPHSFILISFQTPIYILFIYYLYTCVEMKLKTNDSTMFQDVFFSPSFLLPLPLECNVVFSMSEDC